jgi:hypothetical protein
MKVEPTLKDEVKLHAEKQFEKKTAFLRKEILRPGHRCFEVNEKTFETKEAQYERIVNFNEPDTRKIVIKENCVYINALNAPNALKVYKKGGRKIQEPFMKMGEEHNIA